MQEWDERQAAKKQIANFDPYAEAPEDDEEDDDLPFACYICRRPWEEVQEPVVTQCKHYFCEQCALKHNAKSGKCFVCEKPTRKLSSRQLLPATPAAVPVLVFSSSCAAYSLCPADGATLGQ